MLVMSTLVFTKSQRKCEYLKELQQITKNAAEILHSGVMCIVIVIFRHLMSQFHLEWREYVDCGKLITEVFLVSVWEVIHFE